MTTPSQDVKVPQYRRVVKVRRKVPVKPQKNEPKTLFGHINDAMGGHLMGGLKKQQSFLELIKGIVLSLSMFLAVGFIIGTIIDIYLGSGVLGITFALIMALMWLLKKGGKYLWEKM